ncbi:hypothetical protein D9M68_721620 [compost metagenome]
MGRNVDVQVALEFLVDVLQRRRRRHARLHREAQAVGLARTVVGILADDDHFHLLQRRGVQRIEDQRSRREDHLAGGLLLTQEIAQGLHVGLLELVPQGFFPALFELDPVVAISHRSVCSVALAGALPARWSGTL